MDRAVLRPISSSDLAGVCALHNRADAHDGLPRVLSTDELAEDFEHEHLVMETDTRLAVMDGTSVGYAYTYHLPSDVREERCYVFGQVDPAYRGLGVGRALMEWGITRATEQLRSSNADLSRVIRCQVDESAIATHRLCARMGMTPVRWFEELLRPLVDLPTTAAVPGSRIGGWPADRDEEIRQVKNTAFADHWGSTPTSVDQFCQMTHGFGARTDLSFVAVDDHDRVIAYCLNKRFDADDEVLGRREGWIDNLGTLPAWRGRGVASALIRQSLHAFREAGLSHASIGVDSDSPTGAARLYRSLGFEPQRRSVTYEIAVT